MTLSIGGKVIARCTDFTLEINKEVIEITSLSSQGWKEKLVDLKEWKVSFNALVTRGADATYSVYDEMLTNIVSSDDALTVAMADTGVGGTIGLSGSAFLTALSTGVQVGDKMTYNGSLEGTGALSI
jgi:predicted secreted protein